MSPPEAPQSLRALAEISFFPYSEGAILFRPGTRKIWTLNHVAAVIWCLAVDNPNVDAVSARLTSIYGISPEQAKRDTESVLGNLCAEFQQNHPAADFGGSRDESSFSSEVGECEPICPSQETKYYFFKTPGLVIKFWSIEPDVAEEYAEAMKAFAASSVDRLADITILVLLSGTPGMQHYDIYKNNSCCAKEVSGEGLVPALMGVSFSAIAESLVDKLLFHSAVVEKKNRAFLFPGQAGSGKTTLAASLACKGYNFFADELALLDPLNGQIAPLPLPMSVKEGAVAALRLLYPELDDLAVYTRADGKKVKLLPPALSCNFDLSKQAIPTAIIFPRYDSSAAARITTLSKAETIRRLVSLCSSSRVLVEQDIAAMVRLVDENPCYDAVYEDIGTVYDLLEQIRC